MLNKKYICNFCTCYYLETRFLIILKVEIQCKYLASVTLKNDSRHSISYKIARTPSEDSDQPAHHHYHSLHCPSEDALHPWLSTALPPQKHAYIMLTPLNPTFI